MKEYIFRAKSAQGFSGIEVYEERVAVEINRWAMRMAEMHFAQKYGVELDMIEVIEV